MEKKVFLVNKRIGVPVNTTIFYWKEATNIASKNCINHGFAEQGNGCNWFAFISYHLDVQKRPKIWVILKLYWIFFSQISCSVSYKTSDHVLFRQGYLCPLLNSKVCARYSLGESLQISSWSVLHFQNLADVDKRTLLGYFRDIQTEVSVALTKRNS